MKKLNLYEAAFLERIESEKNFYEILKNTVFIKNKPVFEETISSYTIKMAPTKNGPKQAVRD